MSLEFTVIFILIIFDIILLSVVLGKDFFKKKFIEVFVEKKDLNGNKIISIEPLPIGEFKSSMFDSSRNATRIELRQLTKTIIVYCPYTFEKLITQFLYMRYLWVRYVIDALLTEVKIERPQKMELDYSWGWKLYFAFRYCFNYKLGLLISPILMIMLFGFINPTSVEFSLMGAGAGIIIAVINGILFEKGIINPKRKVENIDTELWLYPLESPVKYVDIYNVKYDIEIQKRKKDGTTEIIVDNMAETIEGYEKLFELQTDARVSNLRFEKVRVKKVERDLIDMRNERRDYFTRNAYIWNKITALQSDLIKSTNKIRELHEQISYEQANKHREISDAMAIAYKQAEAKAITLKKMMERQFGAMIVNKSFDKTMSDILSGLQFQEIESVTNRLRELARIIESLIIKIGTSAKQDIDMTEFEDFIKKRTDDLENEK